MIVRPLGADGDIVPIYRLDQMLGGKDAVAQIVNLRLHFFYGEWWEEREMGFRVPEFLVANARKGDIELLSKYISSYISNTEGVKSVINVVSSYTNHHMIFSCTVLTDQGKTENLEVSLDGIL